jgi:hypothetical protein
MICSKNFSLIVPVAADKPEYEDIFPYVFLPGKDGVLLCVKSVLGLNLDVFDSIYFTILKKHNDRYHIKDLMELQFRNLDLNAQVVILDNPTKNQAETIYQTITKMEIKGSLYIKDADSYFTANVRRKNSVAVFPLEQMEYIDPRNKSYVAVDEMRYVTNIIEKRVVSHFFSAGGYCFESIEDYKTYYSSLSYNDSLYISHIIYAMLLNRQTFIPIKVGDYKDWGTSKLYDLYLK